MAKAKTAGKPAKSAKKPTSPAKPSLGPAKPSLGPAKPGAAEKPAPSGFWLFKSEPDVFSYQNLEAKGAKGEAWDGVRNFQARNNMVAMSVGDLGFFYHSNEGKEVVGIVEVIALAHQDPKDDTGRWKCVDVKAVRPMPKPYSLDDAKANPKLAKMVLVNNSRLSVQPVAADEWMEICRQGGLDPKKIKA